MMTESKRKPAFFPSTELALTNAAWMPASSQVAGNHGDDGLRQTSIEIIPLNYQGRTSFSRAQIGIRK
jgi:hypothetical protein